MTRFMQVENIFKLISNRDGDSNFNYRATCELLFSKAELLAFGPSVVVDAVGAEYSGRIVDSLLEPRLVVLIDIAEELKTEESLLLCSRYLDHLITWWRTNPFDFGYAISSLNRLLDSKWVSRSNPNLYSTLLSKFYERLRTANADDWLRIIPFARVEDSNNCIDQAVIDRELEEYRENGAREERQNCSNSSELSELKESLVLLEENFSILFPGEIGRIEEEIAQKEEWEPRSPSGALPDPPTSHELEVMSENEVRQMFMSLKSK
jgi:hypothetical protein